MTYIIVFVPEVYLGLLDKLEPDSCYLSTKLFQTVEKCNYFLGLLFLKNTSV